MKTTVQIRMIFRKIKIALGTAMVLMLLFFGAFLAAPRQFGQAEAKFDLWRGRPCILVYGYPGFFEYERVVRLRRRGVRYVRVAGCNINWFITEYADGYNSTVRAAIRGID